MIYVEKDYKTWTLSKWCLTICSWWLRELNYGLKKVEKQIVSRLVDQCCLTGDMSHGKEY